MTATIIHGECIAVMQTMADNSIDAIVCDPPYGLGFMGKAWDDLPPGEEWARECLRVLKPGGHLLAFGGTRTWHRLAVAVEDAGFEIRDSIAWLYGSGFPKSLDVSKAIDKARDDTADVRVVCRWLRARIDEHPTWTVRTLADTFGFHPRMVEHWAARDTDSQPSLPKLDQWDELRNALRFGDEMDAEVYRLNMRKGEPGEAWADRPVVGAGYRVDRKTGAVPYGSGTPEGHYDITAPATPAAEQWQGWGTALKPAFEPIVFARKPLAGTVAANVLAHGTGALNIDACRIEGTVPQVTQGLSSDPSSWEHRTERRLSNPHEGGRWPANVALDTDQATALDQQTGTSSSVARVGRRSGKADDTSLGKFAGQESVTMGHSDSGGASRFFYVAKAPAKERPFYFRQSCKCEGASPCEETSPERDTDASKLGAGKSWNMSTSGSNTTAGAYPTAMTSTTGTETSSTTPLTISNSSPSSNTSASIQDANNETANGGNHAASVNNSNPSAPLTGTSAPKAGPCTGGAAHVISPEWSQTSKCAVCGSPAKREAHSTVKPLALMRWLIRLVTPPSGTVLDPFAGSGTTLEAAILEGFDVVGVEREADYLPLIQARADRQGVTLAVVSTVAPDNVTPAEEATPAGGDFPCCAPNPVTEPVAEVDPLAQVKADIAAATTYEELLTIYNIATRVTGHHPADIVPLCAARKAELLAAA